MSIEKRKKGKKATDRPERVPYHWIYFVMMILGIIAALWQHGHPYYTVSVLALVVPCFAAAYIPYRIFPIYARKILMWLMIAATFIWGAYRLSRHIPIDMVLIEGICLMALVFSFSHKARTYGYMLLISVLLMLYGSLLPRTIYLAIVPIAFILVMFMIYGSRVNALTGDPTLKIKVFKYNWGKILIHLILLLLFWIYFYTLMPTEEVRGEGLFITSFKNTNTSYLPPKVNNWFKMKHVRRSTTGATIPGKKPTTAGKKGPKVKAKSKQGMSSDGSGAAPPGKDLVFRVKSPAKLYWVGQMYDHYDGDTWSATRYMTRQKKMKKEDDSKSILLEFTIEKWISPVLYTAYRPEYYNLNNIFSPKLESNFYRSSFKKNQNYPGLPFSYSVHTAISSTEVLKKSKDNWPEKTKRSHYLQLPKKKISARLKSLAKKLTESTRDPYKKAIILRNYLRTNYKYKQNSERTPPGREAVDFFIFNLKKGHCEYFASSLAVLTRLCGLPSRVVTGFSPGNYNALTKLFEIHEYHAHAWTQVFFDRYGWLTLDATPPGYIVSRTTPFAIGRLHDPFGNEWKVRPPELAMKVQELATPGESDGSDIKQDLADRILYDIVMLPETIGGAMDRLIEKFKSSDNKKKGFSFRKTFTKIKKAIEKLVKSLKNRFLNMCDWFKTHIILGLICLIGIGLLIMIIPIIFKFLHRIYEKYRCKRWIREAVEQREQSPKQAIHNCYLAVRKMLELNGYPRINNMDLLDYASLLGKKEQELGNSTLAVFFLYNQLEYSPFPVNTAKAKIAIKRTIVVQTIMATPKKQRNITT